MISLCHWQVQPTGNSLRWTLRWKSEKSLLGCQSFCSQALAAQNEIHRRRFPETISGLVSLDETKTLVNGRGQINLICNTRSGWHSVVKFEALYEQESRARLWGGVQPPRAALSKLCQLRYKLLRGTPALLPLVKSTHTHTNSFRYTQFQFLENIRFDVFGRDCKFSILYQTQILPNDQRSAISQLHQICNLSGRHWQLLNSVFRFWVSHLQHL